MSARSVQLPRYSIGVGDRFAQQAAAQLRACMLARDAGVTVAPVWNKSNREHTLIGSAPQSTRAAADAAVQALDWREPYFCDADHVNLQTVDRFIEPCDFFTIDVADRIGQPAKEDRVQAFVVRHPELQRSCELPGVGTLRLTPEVLRATAGKYLDAVEHAAAIYAHIESAKGRGSFVTEVSMDETDTPQTPPELLIILAAIADAGIPIQTIAPKFTGRFNKGVDYQGDLQQFSREFSDDVAVIAHAVYAYGLPANLKLSVHSGSDKFSLYAPMHRILAQQDAGVHLKTAGTTWLEEMIGLAEAGGDGLALAKEIYAAAYQKRAELCAPYTAVIDIAVAELPSPAAVDGWSSRQFTAALRHDPADPRFNASLRQLLHVSFKIAAHMGSRYLDLLQAHRGVVARNVTDNLYRRHIAPLFLGIGG